MPSRYVVEVDGGWSTDLCGRGERGIMELRTASSSNTLDQIKGGEHGDHHHLVAAAIVVNGDRVPPLFRTMGTAAKSVSATCSAS